MNAARQVVSAIGVCAVMGATMVLLRGAQAPAPAGQGPGPQTGVTPAPGRGNADAELFNTVCAACHGVDISGGRAHSLFDQRWLAIASDDYLFQTIKNGKPDTDMPAFRDMSDDQVWRLIHYIRQQTGARIERPAFVGNPGGRVLKTEKQTVKVELVADNLETPWGLAFLPDGRLLVSERPGRLRIIANGQLSAPVKGIPKVHEQQDGGLLDIELHPDYAQNGWIYLSYTEPLAGFVPPTPFEPNVPSGRGTMPQTPSMTVVVRGKLNRNNEWVDQQTIFRAPADLYTIRGEHFGLRFIFDRDRHLFFSIGERGVPANSQNLGTPLGKIHRVNDDGSVPKDNPFVSTPGAVPTIWSYGHRNPEGFAWDPISGRLWESEHGPSGGDEINIIEKGHNYGWGVATKGVQNGITKRSEPGMDEPVVYYTPSIGPSGLSFYTGDRFPGWKNTSLFLSAMAGQHLRRLQIDGPNIVGQEVIFSEFGRVRDIVQGPDGYFYIALQNPTGAGTGVAMSASTPGRVIRLVPN